MKKIKLPNVTFVTCTFNSQKTIGECLDSVASQKYPQDKIKVLIVDGGSTDNTLKIVKKYPFCKVITEDTGRPEAATAIGYNKVTSQFLVNFPSDNVLTSSDWLVRMLQPLLLDSEIVASETLHYHHQLQDKPLNRYFALFGVNDPVPYYLQKQDRASYLVDGWHLPNKATDRGTYFVTYFDNKNLPTIGANGFVIRTKIAQQVSKDPQTFFHIDACLDLVNLGYNKFAFIKNDIWHKTGEEFGDFFKRRLRYAQVYLQDKSMRRYHVFDPKQDVLKLLIYVFFGLTIIEPLSQSVRGYLKVRDWAWFLHPVISFLTVFVYAYSFLRNRLVVK